MLSAVHVVEIEDLELISVASFPDTTKGRDEARDHFIDLAKGRGATQKEAESFVDEDEYYEAEHYQLYIKF